jgi:lipid A 3-O-deacylase PagL
MRARRRVAGSLLTCLGIGTLVFAQAPEPPGAREDTRTQYPSFLANSYVSVSAGFLDYAFSPQQLEPGFHAAAIDVPHAAARVALFGHELTPTWSVQCTYMRPVQFVAYRNVDGDGLAHKVWMGFGGLTLKARAPIAARISVYGEAGLGITSRRGFAVAAVPVVRDARYASVLLGAGADYELNAAWDLTAGATYSAPSAPNRQPRSLLAAGGFRYTMRPLPEDRVLANRQSGAAFPAHLLQIEYATGYGYGINAFLSTKVPVFWSGDVKVDRGLAIHYDHNVFHTARRFALDLGTSAAEWRTRSGRDRFFTLSVYPLFRFIPLRSRRADLYAAYSLAGPSYISRLTLDGQPIGSRFTFQDFMGAGVLVGRHRTVTLGVTINHYSNGNIFPANAGVKIPVTLGAGWAF